MGDEKEPEVITDEIAELQQEIDDLKQIISDLLDDEILEKEK